MLARLATRKAKPAGSYHLTRSGAIPFLATVDVSQLHGIGYSIRSKAEDSFGTTLLSELGQIKQSLLCSVLGKKTGEMIWNAARGIDNTQLESDKPRKSVSCDINVRSRIDYPNSICNSFGVTSSSEFASRTGSKRGSSSSRWQQKFLRGFRISLRRGER